MSSLIGLAILVFVIIWAVRIETGINRLNNTAERIERQLGNKKEKK